MADMSDSKLTLLFEECDDDYIIIFDFLKTLMPPAVDIEIRSLQIDADFTSFKKFLAAIRFGLNKNQDFELVQSYLTVFLRIHGDIIKANAQILSSHLKETKELIEDKWSRIETKVNYALCLTDLSLSRI